MGYLDINLKFLQGLGDPRCWEEPELTGPLITCEGEEQQCFTNLELSWGPLGKEFFVDKLLFNLNKTKR